MHGLHRLEPIAVPRRKSAASETIKPSAAESEDTSIGLLMLSGSVSIGCNPPSPLWISRGFLMCRRASGLIVEGERDFGCKRLITG